LFDSAPSKENSADRPASSLTCPKGSVALEEGGSDCGEGLSVGVGLRIVHPLVSRPVSASASTATGRPRREAVSPDGGPKKSLLAHRKALSLLVREGVKATAVNAGASTECGTSMTSSKKA
jgi:hypothetical protein